MGKQVSMVLAVLSLVMTALPGMDVSNVDAKMRETRVKIPECSSGVKQDEFGIAYVQETAESPASFLRLISDADKKTSDTFYHCCKYTLKGKKLVKRKLFTTKPKSTLNKIVGKDFNLPNSCMDKKGKYQYVPYQEYLENRKKPIFTMPVIKRISVNSGKIKTIKVGKQCRGLGLNESNGNSLKCFYAANNLIGVRMVSWEKKWESPTGYSYKACLLNTKTGKIVKEMDCNYIVQDIKKDYICGFSDDAKGKLCVQSWKKGSKVKKVAIDDINPLTDKHPAEYNDLQSKYHQRFNRAFVSGGNVYFTTKMGVYRCNISSGKVSPIIKTKNSKYLRKCNYFNGITRDQKGKTYVLGSKGWRSGNFLVRI